MSSRIQRSICFMATVSHDSPTIRAAYRRRDDGMGLDEDERMSIRNVIIGVLLSASLVSMIIPCQVWAQSQADSRSGDAARGQVIFTRHCAGCHGPEGKGDGYRMLGPDPANLTGPSTTEQSDGALLNTIHEGKSNMPSWNLRLSEEDSRAALSYIRTLSK